MRHLHAFVDIADSGSVTASAQRLHTSQPALSRAVAELEGRLNCRLFDRTPNGLHLTAEGRRLQTYVLAAFEQLEAGLSDVECDYGTQSVRVAILPTVSRTLFPRAVVRFKEEFPNVSIELETRGDATLPDTLRRGDLDFAIGRLGTSEKMDGLSFNHLYSEPLLFVAHHTHPLSTGKAVGLSDIAGYLMLVPLEGVVLRDELDHFLIANDQPRIANKIETISFEFIRAFLPTTQAIAFCPAGAVSQELARNEFIDLELGDPQLMGAVGITTNARRKLGQPAKRLIQLIEEEAAKPAS
ncbi:hypothetical protein RA27_17700 [Ruegeria sp. ANG-R]|nr:hypothetical protein RA27_17700 [Ruegeria sp. ANG-R]